MLMTIRRKFNECDLNDSGTIERDELAGLLRAPDLEKYMVRAPQELTSPYVFRDGRGGQDPGRGSRGDDEVAKAEAEAALQQAEQERTHPFSLTGHPIANYNGRYKVAASVQSLRYKVDRMHGESPALKNANGMYCYRHAATGSWFLNDEFTPDSELCYTCIESEGPLPVGANAWQNCVDDQLVEQELTTTVTEEFATELRLRAECLAAKREGGASVEPGVNAAEFEEIVAVVAADGWLERPNPQTGEREWENQETKETNQQDPAAASRARALDEFYLAEVATKQHERRPSEEEEEDERGCRDHPCVWGCEWCLGCLVVWVVSPAVVFWLCGW
jgi:hypothetical protein